MAHVYESSKAMEGSSPPTMTVGLAEKKSLIFMLCIGVACCSRVSEEGCGL